MASLEDRILGGKNAGYCSSSDDDDEGNVVDGSEDLNVKSKEIRNTGPKGVLDDWKQFCEEQKRQQEIKERMVVEEAKRGTLCIPKESDGNELDVIRERRLKQLRDRSEAQRKIIELLTKEQFLSAIENCRNRLLLIHIYEDSVDACNDLNYVLCSIAVKYAVKVARVKSSVLETSKNFRLNALPTLQVYYNDSLVGNFVRLVDNLRENFNAMDLVDFLYERDIDLLLNTNGTD